MATKKQKHAAAMAKRERWLATVRADGLRAQREDQQNRENKAKQASDSKSKSKSKKHYEIDRSYESSDE